MINNILNSKEYQEVLNLIVQRAKIEIYPSYPDTIAKIDQDRLVQSGLTEDQIIHFLASKPEIIKIYNLEKLRLFNDVTVDEEYNPEYPPEKEEDDNIKNHGFMKSFLLFNVIEHMLLIKSEVEIIQYLTAIRIPNKSKYLKQIQKIQSTTRN